ncbi:uncharacterized protein MYCFIDRAFT_80905 [Pseudocercospora fijiensis CIRAD86]|uniref:Uncharacterized protein n=1 Tax=Pseudocercospora fijiensis (strain CIRAD86) TaxID=383855 RepID=M2YL77_PSEFD|nr:uncharacterized protein MYCFIDRAFT_80905 [Pseudocercospora fijiensis CIRAD86]EME78490.1 hypothetical protein MYCFIDRAFT_80905 [Pseudocercospora fijiensis CIRAD86]
MSMVVVPASALLCSALLCSVVLSIPCFGVSQGDACTDASVRKESAHDATCDIDSLLATHHRHGILNPSKTGFLVANHVEFHMIRKSWVGGSHARTQHSQLATSKYLPTAVYSWCSPRCDDCLDDAVPAKFLIAFRRNIVAFAQRTLSKPSALSHLTILGYYWG